MNRSDFQQLAELRNDEAGILLTQGKPDGAYYLTGYAIECGLKACVARLTKEFDFPDKALATKCYTHSIKVLFDVAGLGAQRDADAAANPGFAANMRVLEDWSEGSRYERKTFAEARQLYDAVNDPTDGVFPWLKSRW